MTGLAVTGWSVISPAGVGADALASGLGGAPAGQSPAGLYDDPLPSPTPHALAGFDVRHYLGRKGTSFFDRCTGLALIACGQALNNSGVTIDDANRHRVGIALGTTTGSMRSTMDYSRETLIEDRPYLVNPLLFPNTVMNCAAGQAAIWHRLTGVNTTIAGGQLAFLGVLRYSATALRGGYADIILAGTVEELSPHSAWATRLGSDEPDVAAGEGAAAFVVERADDARRAGRRLDAEVLAVAMGFSPGGAEGGGTSAALTGCVRRALAMAGIVPEALSAVATGDVRDGGAEAEAVEAAIGAFRGEWVVIKTVLGECHAASGGLQVAALLGLHRDDPTRDGQCSLVTSRSRDGGVGAAVLRGWSRASAHRG
jgi:3-oxoacyl-[acyl-carrier-protein] synthase II